MLLLSACAPKEGQPTENAAGGKDDVTMMEDWSAGSDCKACHTAQQASMEDDACLASRHVATACITCHSNENDLAVVHEEKSGNDPNTLKSLKTTSIENEVCLGCHGTWEELAQNTVDTDLLTDANGKTVNPHEVTTLQNEKGQHDEITCVDCHKIHSSEGVDVTAFRTCQSCHHDNVYECGTCHEIG